MLVDLVELRACGVKIPPEVLRDVKPIRGLLTLDRSWANLHETEETRFAALVKPIWFPRILKIRAGSFVLAGQQWRSAYNTNDPWPQAWWCRCVTALPEEAMAEA